MNNKIHFYLPDFYHFFHINTVLIDMISQKPEFFYDNIKISAIYGTFPSSIWNGGRVYLGFCKKGEILHVLKELQKRDVACRFTFTNSLLEEKHLYDTFCNMCLRLANNGKNEVLVNSPLLEDYIRSNYPDYKIISSTTKCIRSIDEIEKETKRDYSLVVIDSSYNNTDELFELPDKDRYELLVNHYCQYKCPNSAAHYESISRSQLEFSEPDFKKCKHINQDFFRLKEQPTFITVEDLYEKYVPAGFCHFKFDGRGFNILKAIESYVYFLVKPEHRDKARMILIRTAHKFKEL